MNRKGLIIAGAALVLLIGAGLFFLLKGRGAGGDTTINQENSGSDRRANMLLLAREYADQGEYDMALGLINDLLLENAQDQDARDLRDSILSARRQAEEAAKQAELDALKAQNEELSKGLQELSSTLQNQNQESPAEKAARLAAEEDARRKKLLQEQQVSDLVDQARDAIRSREYDRAIGLAKQALAIDPGNYDAQSVKKQAEDLKKAAESDAEKKAREDREKRITSLLDQAEEALGSGDYSGARRLAEQVLELDPDNGRALSLMGQSWYEEDPESSANRRKARENLEKALEEDPEDWQTYYYLGQIAEDEDDDMEAIENYVKAAGLNGTSPEIFYSLGILQYRNQLYKEALSSFKKVENLNRNYEGNYYAMGLTHNKLGDRQNALASFVKSCELRPTHAASFYETGKAFNAAGNSGQAIFYLTKAVQIKPDPRYYFTLGGVYYAAQDYANGVESFSKTVELDPGRADAMYNISICYLNMGEYTSSLSWSTKAVQKEPANPVYLYTMGQGAEYSGMEDQALEIYKKSAALDSAYASPRINLGKILDRRGDYVSALQYLQQAYQSEPDNVLVWKNLGSVFLHMEQYQNSVKWYEKAVAREPEDADNRYSLGLGYIALEDNEKAVVQLEKAIELNPQYWDAYLNLAKVYYAMGNRAKAKEVGDTLLKKNPNYDKKDELTPIMS